MANKISWKYFESPLLVSVLSHIEALPSYSLDIHFNIIHDPDLCALITFHSSKFMYNSPYLRRSKWSVPVRGVVKYSVTQSAVTVLRF